MKKNAETTVDAAAQAPTSALVKIVQTSGLAKEKADFLIQKFDGFMDIARQYEETARTIVVTADDQVDLMARARKGRLYLKEIRVDIEKTRKALKEESLREGKAIDAVANALKALIEPTEAYLDSQERFTEIRERKKREDQAVVRQQALLIYDVALTVAEIVDMTDEMFNIILKGAIDKKKEAEAKANADAQEKKKLAEENARLKQINDEREAELRIERDRLAQIERQAEAKKKADADAEAARVKAEKKAASAPDKTKLLSFANTLEEINVPACVSDEANGIRMNVIAMLQKMTAYIRANAENL
jgi:hypothetical protein